MFVRWEKAIWNEFSRKFPFFAFVVHEVLAIFRCILYWSGDCSSTAVKNHDDPRPYQWHEQNKQQRRVMCTRCGKFACIKIVETKKLVITRTNNVA